jgi:hypothetical protein
LRSQYQPSSTRRDAEICFVGGRLHTPQRSLMAVPLVVLHKSGHSVFHR